MKNEVLSGICISVPQRRDTAVGCLALSTFDMKVGIGVFAAASQRKAAGGCFGFRVEETKIWYRWYERPVKSFLSGLDGCLDAWMPLACAISDEISPYLLAPNKSWGVGIPGFCWNARMNASVMGIFRDGSFQLCPGKVASGPVEPAGKSSAASYYPRKRGRVCFSCGGGRSFPSHWKDKRHCVSPSLMYSQS